MKTLKESILNRSSHGAEGFEAQRRNLIEKWLKEYNIKDYTINDDFTIDVNGDVYLYKRDLKEFPDYIQFGLVVGDFDCSTNKFTSLRGCPIEVEKDFVCNYNNLTSLKGAPERVGTDFYCNNNRLTSLKNAPKEVGNEYNCSFNKLTSLEGAPKIINSLFYCDHNQLTSLKGAPKEVRGEFDCSRNSTQFTEEDVRKVCNVKRNIIV